MRKLLLALALFPSLATAQTPVQSLQPIVFGYTPYNLASGNSEYDVNAANDRLCWSFVLSDNKTLSSVRVEITTVTGSPIAADIDGELKADSSGVPNGSSLETRDVSSVSAAVSDWTGYSTALTAGTKYWWCIKNSNGTPGTNYVRIRIPDSSSSGPTAQGFVTGDSTKQGWNFCSSTDAGATCATLRQEMPILRLGFSDSTYAGSGFTGNGWGSDTTNKIHGSLENGVRFTVPADGPGINVRCISMNIGVSGTAPAGGLRYRLYTGTGGSRTLVDTTTTVTSAEITSLSWVPACFTATQTIAAGTVVSIVAGAASGGDASNYFYLTKNTIDDTAASKALTFAGGTQGTYLNGTFADTSTIMYPFALMLDTNDPFNVSAGGGSDKNQGINGGLNK